jgi:glycosyltransferase involved in cell wall biosynthesis
MLELELGQPLPELAALEPATRRVFRHAHVLVRLHRLPVGVVELSLPATPVDYAPEIWAALGSAIRAHLQADGYPLPASLPLAGLPATDVPLCRCRRAAVGSWALPATVIVCTRDRTDQLRLCLDQLLAMDYPDLELIVVDNAPATPATRDLLATRYAKRIRYVVEPRPGLSWARNCGLAQARGDIVAFTDDDVRADPAWLSELALAFDEHPDAACVTGIVLPAELETEAQLWFEEFGGFNKGRGFESQRFTLTSHQSEDPLHPYLTSKCGAGANMAFRTEALRQLGGFVPALGIGTPTFGGEDIEAYFRVLAAGHALVTQPTAILRHYHRADPPALRRQLHGYGVAFTAYLTRCVVDRPGRLLDLLSRAPRGMAYLVDPASVRNRRKTHTYPADLTRSELWGMALGPWAYWRSQRQVARLMRGQVGAMPEGEQP